MKQVKADGLRFKVRSERLHRQIVTNRNRQLYVQHIDERLAWLFIETVVITTTTQHRSYGKLYRANMTNSRSNNWGLISKHIFVDLVKPIYRKDIPAIIKDFDRGIPMHKIKYSNWAFNFSPPPISRKPIIGSRPVSCTKGAIRHDTRFASSHKNMTFTTRLIKTVSALIGF